MVLKEEAGRMEGELEHSRPRSVHYAYELPGVEFLRVLSPALAALHIMPTTILHNAGKRCSVRVTGEKTEALKD